VRSNANKDDNDRNFKPEISRAATLNKVLMKNKGSGKWVKTNDEKGENSSCPAVNFQSIVDKPNKWMKNNNANNLVGEDAFTELWSMHSFRVNWV
jgi:hypothetical protein